MKPSMQLSSATRGDDGSPNCLDDARPASDSGSSSEVTLATISARTQLIRFCASTSDGTAIVTFGLPQSIPRRERQAPHGREASFHLRLL